MEQGQLSISYPRAELEMKKDEDMWMSDGNIVLAAVDSESEAGAQEAIRLFRCHMSVLAMHSTVFEDVFATDLRLNVEQYEGLPLLALTDDCNDLKNLLRILYDPFRLPPPRYNITDWEDDILAIAGPLRLAAKYDFKALHSRGTEILKTYWPTTLSAWDAISDAIADAKADPSWTPINPAPVGSLAYEANIPDILPAVLYELMTCYNGFWRHKPPHPSSPCDQFRQFVQDLDPRCLIAILEAKELFRLTVTHLVTDVFEKRMVQSPHCLQPDCKRHIEVWWAPKYADFFSAICSPLCTLTRWGSQLDSETTICAVCREFMCTTLARSRQYLWDELPFYFRLKDREASHDYDVERYLDTADS